MNPDKLISGNPYWYEAPQHATREVIYQRIVRLPNDVTAYNFRLRNGFVNLLEHQVRTQLHDYSVFANIPHK